MRKFFMAVCVIGGLCALPAGAQDRLPGYLQAEKFTADKLRNMLFSTYVDPHWFQQGSRFWYQYKTSEGDFWYVVDPDKKRKELLFDREDMAARLTEIVQDPFEARHLPIRNLKAKEDGRTFTFEVASSREKKDSTGKPDGKEIFYFSYDLDTRELTHLKDQEKEPKRLRWGNVSPDGKSVVYAKDCNLYRMSIEDYEKARRDEKDSTIVEIQLTTDGTPDFGYGIPYSLLNTDTLCDGSRRYAWGCWSPDSRHFATIAVDNRQVKELWVINALASPRPTLETYKYQMPGEMEAPVEHLHVFDMTDNSRKDVRVAAYKNQSLGLEFRPLDQRQRDAEYRHAVWQGDNDRFYLTRSSRDLHRVDLCSYTVGADSVVPVVRERMNTYQETRPVHILDGGKRLIQWSERDGWAHLYLYAEDGTLLNRVTEGPWHVEEVLRVDEKAGVVYFVANGRNPEETPYYTHLYRVNLDGSGLKQLTRGDYFHRSEIDDDARFIVDNNQEYSLRGEIAGRARIIFAPITKPQERSLSDLFLQMREGGTLKIGLLQGERDRVRTYEIPLAGFMDYSDRILQSCQNYNQSYNGQQQYLPDYMSKEPSGYAPKQYSLKQPTEEIIDPYAPQPQAQPEPATQEETPKAPPREVLPFVPGGGPASIGPDGLPVGAQGSSVQGQAGAQVDASLGTASGPMQIGPDGMPITNSASASASAQGANANAAASATSQGPSFDANGNLLPAGQGANGTQPANGQQPNQANPVMDNIF